MFKSIQQFEEGGINNLQKVEKEFISTKDMAGLVTGISREVMNLGIGIIEETLEYYDEVIRQRAERKEKWQVVRRDRKSLITSLGTVQYYKTLYKDKKTGECCYLLDSNLGLDDHQRMTEDAEAKLQGHWVYCDRNGNTSDFDINKLSQKSYKEMYPHFLSRHMHMAKDKIIEVWAKIWNCD